VKYITHNIAHHLYVHKRLARREATERSRLGHSKKGEVFVCAMGRPSERFGVLHHQRIHSRRGVPDIGSEDGLY
jgi:hypothetical protein